MASIILPSHFPGKLRMNFIRILPGDKGDRSDVTLRPHPRPYHLAF